MFFPFVRNSRPGGGVLSESFEPFLRVLNLISQYFVGVLTRDREGIASEYGHLAPPKKFWGAKLPFSEAYIIKINTFDLPWGCLAPPSS